MCELGITLCGCSVLACIVTGFMILQLFILQHKRCLLSFYIRDLATVITRSAASKRQQGTLH